MTLHRALSIVVAAAAVSVGCGGGSTTGARGPYLGQEPPGDTPRLFAAGIVSTGMYERDIAMTPDGRELYFCVAGLSGAYARILVTRQRGDGRWTTPEVVSFSAAAPGNDIEPFITADGSRLYFTSNRASGKGGQGYHLWVTERRGDRWGEPSPLPAPIGGEGEEYFPSLSDDGTLYFTGERGPAGGEAIYRARPVDGGFAAPERLPETVNAGRSRFNALVAGDESFLIVSIAGLEEGVAGSAYYVCFRASDDSWSEPVNLGPAVNAPGAWGYSPALSPDGRYLFFMSARTVALDELAGSRLSYDELRRLHSVPGNGSPDVWWVSSAVIESLRPR